MASLFCPYLGDDVDEAQSSLEHVVPESLGGTSGLAIRVDRASNIKLGTAVDGPVAQLFAGHRVKYNLKGHSGNEPSVMLSGSVEDLGGLGVELELTPAGGSVRLKPSVTRDRQADGSVRVSVRGEPEEAQRIYANIKRTHEAKGKTVQTEDQFPQTLQNLRVTGNIKVDLLALARFQAKVALGIGHMLWGPEWSRSPGAQLIRRVLWSTTVGEANAVGLQGGNITPETLGFVLDECEHAFVVSGLPDGTCALASFFFGQVGTATKLGTVNGVSLGCWPIVLLLNVETGILQRPTSLELYRNRRKAAREEPPRPCYSGAS